MSSFLRDLRYALRTLRHSPGYTAAAILSLALGIGANTAIFTLTNAVFLNPLPVKDPSRIIELFQVDHATQSTAPNLTRTPVSYPNFVDLRDQADVFTGMAGYAQTGLTLTGLGKPQQQQAFVVTANYFDVLGLHAAAGRLFRPDEDRTPGANAVVVLSHSLAQKLYGGDRAAIGHILNLNTVSYEVIGVAPSDFKGTLTIGPPDVLWLPLSMHAQVFEGIIEKFFQERRFRFFSVFARMKPGVDEQTALTALRTIAARLEAAYPKDNRGRTIETAPLNQAALGFVPRGQSVSAALALSAAVGFVLLIACANIANLSLARAARRQKEMGIRMALGAARKTLIWQLLTEAELLAIAGGIAGILVGWFGAQFLWAFRPGFLEQTDIALSLDLHVCAFTAGVTLLTGLLFGIAPVLQASRPDLSTILNSGGRGGIQGGGRSLVRQLLVVGEIALAMVALAGAGLFIRSMQRAQRIDLGFETQNLAVFSFDLGSEHMPADRGREFIREAVEKVKTVPGVADAAVSNNAPIAAGFVQTAFREGDPIDSRLGVLSMTSPVTPGFFSTLRIPLLEGRLLNDFDRADSTHVAVITDAMARRVWPGQPALGKRFRFATDPLLWQVVGIVKNVTMFSVGEPPTPAVFVPAAQEYRPFGVMHLRTTGNPDTVLPAAMAAVQSLNPDLALLFPATAHELVGQALWAPRAAAALFGIFGLLSVALAVIGVYGVIAYMVLQRTNEIGIRMAMGARAQDVIGMVLRHNLRLAGAGILAGLAVAMALTRLVADLLFDVSPNDPTTFLVVVAILSLTAMAAGGIPAWRASRIDPVTALRRE